MSSMYLSRLKISIFGQSHAPAIGVVIDGLPPGEKVDLDALQRFLSRRAPGRDETATARREADAPEILCGLSNGVTCASPLTAIIRNTNTRPGDYAALMCRPRPGHADYTAQVKYHGFQDASGGGHFSGRLTAPLCIAGGIAMQILARRGVQIGAHLASVADVCDEALDPAAPDMAQLAKAAENSLPTLSLEAGEKMRAAIMAARAASDSVGGIIECAAAGVPAGLGDPMFDGMENRIARIAFAIPAVKGVEFGAGFGAAQLRGSENNDPFTVQNGRVVTAANRAGGILGGITTGMPVLFRAAVKPTPSIALPQRTVDLTEMKETEIEIKGRHDPCIAPRAVPCMEAAMAIALLDAWLEKDNEVK